MDPAPGWLPPSPGLYVHVPFCRRRCGYCAFHAGEHRPAAAARWLEALGREADARARGRACATAYVGGGTPTALDDGTLARLLARLAPLARRAREYTVEANPGRLSPARARLLRRGGADRLSLGVQTFQPRGLAALGRVQAPGAAAEAVAAARRAGFRRIGLDLIAGWPGQTLAEWRDDLGRAAALGPEHLSCYGLSVEPGTRLAAAAAAGRAALPDGDFGRDCWDEADRILARAGYARYETSNFCRPGGECLHHAAAWTGGEYVGLGPAAHSHLRGRRSANVADTARYAARWLGEEPGGTEVFSEILPPAAKARETLVLWLRLSEGADREAFARRTGLALEEAAGGVLPGLLARGLLEWSGGGRRLRLPPALRPVADGVLCELV